MDAGWGEDPPGTADAAAAADYVRRATAELEVLQRDLPGLEHLDWRSRAADAFSALLQECVSHVRQALAECETSAEALSRYDDALQMAGWEDG